jgi:filamentous hemagglutinin family protein
MACKLKSSLIQAAYRNTGLKMNKKTVIAVICLFTVITPGLADITTDGTVGPAAQLAGPQFQIGQELGSLSGNNLFHSFVRFNLNSSESATFTGDSHIQNVISRVTGGALSNIDGALKSEIGQAAFYFINPAGIVFGPNAQIDVSGAFYASTAGELKFADGTKFSALNPQGNTLTMTAPESFGFVGKQTGTMELNGAELVFKPGMAIHLSAAKIAMDNTSLTGEGMDLQLASVGNDKQDVGVASLPDQALAGTISIKETVMDASGNGKGRIALRGGDLEAGNSQINANNIGNLDMPANQGIDIIVGNLSLDDTDITSDSSDEGNSGTVNVIVQNELKQIKGSSIRSAAFGNGDSGKVTVNAGNILIDGENTSSITGIATRVIPGSRGNAGAVKIEVQQDIKLVNGGQITTTTFGEGDAGMIEIKAGALVIIGQEQGFSSGIFSTAGDGSSGDAGNINIAVKNGITLLNAGIISASTDGMGDAANVNANAETILVNSDMNPTIFTGITSESLENATGNSGSINIHATKLISMTLGLFSIASKQSTESLVNTNAKLTVNTPQLKLSKNSIISAEAFGTLPASSILINVSQLTLDNSSITTAANEVEGGAITINSNDWIQLKKGRISTSVGFPLLSFNTITANGGDININTDVLVLDTGFIQANTTEPNASGGNINLNVKQLVASRGILQTGGNRPLSFSPNSGINVIQAAAPDGINGTINNTAPQLNIVGTLVGLNTPQVDLNRVGHDPCSSTVQQSTMKKLGKGGIPSFNKGQDNYTIDRLLPKKLDRSSQTSDLSTVLPDSHDCHPKTMHPQPQNMTKQAG